MRHRSRPPQTIQPKHCKSHLQLYAGKIWRQKHEKLRRTGCAIACVPNDLNVLVFRDFLFFVCVGNEYRGREKVVGVVNEFEISKTEMLFCILVIRNG